MSFFSDILFPLQKPLSPTPPRPHPTPRNGPETNPKQSRNGAKWSQTEPKRSQTELKWTEIKLFGVGRAGGLSEQGVGGCKGKRNHYLSWVRTGESGDRPTEQISLSLSVSLFQIQRKRDDNKNKICAFQGGPGQGGREENGPKRFFSWKFSRQ